MKNVFLIFRAIAVLIIFWFMLIESKKVEIPLLSVAVLTAAIVHLIIDVFYICKRK